MSKAQTNSLNQLQALSEQFKKSLSAATRLAYLKSYEAMLNGEILAKEKALELQLRSIKKKKRFVNVKKYLMGSFDIDQTILQKKQEIEVLIASIKDKSKEKDLAAYEQNVLIEILSEKDLIQKAYETMLDLTIENYQPKGIEEQSIYLDFENKLNALQLSKHKATIQHPKIKILKMNTDELLSVFRSAAYGYQDEKTQNLSPFGYGTIKKMKALSHDVLVDLEHVWGDPQFSSLNVNDIDQRKVRFHLVVLSDFKMPAFNLSNNYNFPAIENALTSLKIKVAQDFNNLSSNLKILEQNIHEIKERRIQWFKKLHKLS